MSTRALTVVYNNYDEPLVVIYCHSGGDRSGCSRGGLNSFVIDQGWSVSQKEANSHELRS